jgi:membrane fusion protein (multidrug efflux system)
MRIKLLGLIVALALALFFVWRVYFSSPLPPPSPPPAAAAPVMPPTPVVAARVLSERVEETADAVGGLDASDSVALRPEIAGRVSAIRFTEGQKVKAGEVLVDLDAEEQRANLAQSEAQAQMDKLSFQRIRDIRAKNLVSQQQCDEALAKLKNSEALRERDRVRLAKTRLLAPFDGVLGLRSVSVGDYVAPGQALVNLESLEPIRLDFMLPEKYAARLKRGERVEAQVDAWPGKTFKGAIHAIDPRLDEAARALRVRAHLPNAGHELKPGMAAQVRLQLGGARLALFAPEQAIVAKGSQTFVYRTKDGKAVATPVKIGMRRPGWVEIAEGLSEGEEIVVDGQIKLRDGTQVNVVKETP